MRGTVSDEKVVALLREAVAAPVERGPSRDLWPSIRLRMNRGIRSHPPRATDWLLAAAIALLCLLQPGLAGILLLHF